MNHRDLPKVLVAGGTGSYIQQVFNRGNNIFDRLNRGSAKCVESESFNLIDHFRPDTQTKWTD